MNPFPRLMPRTLAVWLCCFSVLPRLMTAEPAPAAPMIEGVWTWDFPMPDGTTAKPRLMLMRQGDTLSGATSFRLGSAAAITNVAFNGQLLRFQVIRPGADGPVTTTYTGQWNGTHLTGKIESDWAGDKQTHDWQARQIHAGVGGTWRWTTPAGGRDIETRVDLTQRGGVITGFAPTRGGRGGRAVANGTIQNGEIAFELPAFTGPDARRANLPPVRYHGRQNGDRISGTITHLTNNVERVLPWEARRDE